MSATAYILYSHIDAVSDNDLNHYIKLLPKNMATEILRYKFLPDRKLRLLARLMLLYMLKKSKNGALIGTMERTLNNKPFIKGWLNFSISHSGKIAVLGLSECEMGIDLEIESKIDYAGISQYFYKEEQELIMDCEDGIKKFYEIWVKKEAVLKAVGEGIVNGLKEVNCISEQVVYKDKKWFLKPVELVKDHTCFICTSEKNIQIKIRSFNLNLLNKYEKN